MAGIKPTPRSINSDPAVAGYAVTPSDSADFDTGPCRALYIGVTGDVTMTVLQNSAGGTTWQAVLFKAVPVGILPVGCARVNSTATTATNIVALY